MSDTGSNAVDAPRKAVGLSDLFRMARTATELGLRVSCPARVVAYDSIRQRVDVTLELLTVVRGSTPQTADVETSLAPLPLPGVPVLQLGGAAWHVAGPIQPGDLGLVVFADRSIEDWKTAGVALPPKGSRRHSPADGVFIPGLHPDSAPIVPPVDPAALELEAVALKLGALAVQPAVLGTALQSALDTFATTVATAATTWAGATPAAPAFATALSGAAQALSASLAAILSTKVRVE